EIPTAWPENSSLRSTMKRSFNQIIQMSSSEQRSQQPATDVGQQETVLARNEQVEKNVAGMLVDLRNAFESAGKRIEKCILDDTLPMERRLATAELLSGLYSVDVQKVAPNAFDMAAIEKKIDELFRVQLVDRIRETLDRHRKLNPAISMELYRDVIGILKSTQDAISRVNLSFTKSKYALNNELKDAIALLQERMKRKNYTVQMWIECTAPTKATLSINFKSQQEEKPVDLKEQKNHSSSADGLVSYAPATNPTTFTFPLDTKVPTLVVSQYNMDKDSWEDFRHSTSLVSDRTASLGEYGMPLVFQEEVSFRVNMTDSKNNSVILQLRIQPSYDSLPELLWSIPAPKKEKKDNNDAKKSTNL
ncbi:MAG: hypothetical protein Q4G59_01015, partial [Planctomycetia bacterium]|nr:hypothetical protein [Planctomycetia bacterium]